MPSKDDSLWGRLREKLTPVNLLITVLGMIATAAATGVGKPILSWVTDHAEIMRDAATCGGRAAMAEGDRLSTQAAADVARAQLLFREANVHYAKAYACGFPDAGIRLAVAHCMGLGTAKEPSKARQIVLQIEGKHPEKVGRAGDVRKACNL